MNNPTYINQTPCNPVTRDTMPREVAIAMLTAPKAKLTNRMRKRCREALAKIFLSDVPLLRRRTEDGISKHPEDRRLYPSVGCTDEQREFNAERKLAPATLRQLLRWTRRCARQRAKYQFQYLQLSVEPDNEQPRARALRLRQCVILESVVRSLDASRDALDDALDRRKTVGENVRGGLSHIDPAVRRHYKLLAACGV